MEPCARVLSLCIMMNKTISVSLFLICFGVISSLRAANIELPEMGDSAGALISPQEEYRIGQAFFWRLQQSVDLIEDPEITSYLQLLGYRLVSNSDAPSLPFQFFMVPDSTINAFAAPGGFIGINSGLMLVSETEDEMASVLAHEIAHITQRHLLRGFEKTEKMRLPMTAAMIAAALLGAYDPKMGSAAIMAVQAGGVQMQLDFTRAHEAEADNLGMQTLVRSGFEPDAMPSFFEKLQQNSRFYGGGEVPEFLRTHPVTLNRIADARGRAVQYTKKAQLSDKLQFYLMREKLRVMMSDNLAELIRHYQDRLQQSDDSNKDPLRYGYSLALLATGEITQARTALQPLLDKDVDRLSYQLALADIEIAVGRMTAALSIYEEAQTLYPDDRALSLQQVKALLLANQPQKAVAILQRQLDFEEPSRTVYKLLAQARGDMGHKSQAHSALAEYYYLSGRLKQAADQLRLAADSARTDEYELAKISSRLRQIETMMLMLEQ